MNNVDNMNINANSNSSINNSEMSERINIANSIVETRGDKRLRSFSEVTFDALNNANNMVNDMVENTEDDIVNNNIIRYKQYKKDKTILEKTKKDVINH